MDIFLEILKTRLWTKINFIQDTKTNYRFLCNKQSKLYFYVQFLVQNFTVAILKETTKFYPTLFLFVS